MASKSTERGRTAVNFIVTGGAGFLGSHIVDALLDMDHNVAVIDNLTTGISTNLSGKEIAFIKSDCADIPFGILNSEAVVVHCAAQPKCSVSTFMPERDAIDNYLPGVRLVTRALRAGVRRIVLVSSLSVYGSASPLPYVEQMEPKPEDPYAIHKLALERLALAQCSLHETELVIVRPQHVFGPRQRSDLAYRNVIARWIRRALAELPLPVFGSLDLARAFSPVSLVTRGIVAASLAPEVDGDIFNLGSSNVRTLREIAAMIERAIGKSVEYSHMEKPKTLRLMAYGSVSKASRVLRISEQSGEFEMNFELLVGEICSTPRPSSEKLDEPELMDGTFARIYRA